MGELLHEFGIDWKLLAAQAINFLILLFILRRFAYQPILRALRKRREEIHKGLVASQQATARLREVEGLKEKTMQRARQDALAIVAQAEETGRRRQAEILVEANRRVETVVADGKRLIQEEQAKMGEVVYREAEELIERGIEQVIGKLPAEVRNRELVRLALQELRNVKHV